MYQNVLVNAYGSEYLESTTHSVLGIYSFSFKLSYVPTVSYSTPLNNSGYTEIIKMTHCFRNEKTRIKEFHMPVI
jgi:hypothetical protein